MRVTNRMMGRVTLYNLDQIRNRLYGTQTDLATGVRLHRPSDDPAGVVESMRLGTSLSRLERYELNLSDAKSFLDRTDTALDHMVTMVHRIKELMLEAASEAVPTEARRASAREVSQLLVGLVDVANSDYAGQYIFGGQETAEMPFTVTETPATTPDGETYTQYTVTYNGPGTPDQEALYREIAPGVKVQVNIGGEELRLPRGEDLFARVQAVVDHMMNDETDLLSGDDLAALNRIEDGLLGLRAAVGARSKSVEMAQQRALDLRVTLESHKEQVEGIDVARTLIQFNEEEMAYQTALGVSARILPRSLLDFLR